MTVNAAGRHRLAVFFLLSMVLHALVLVGLPGIKREVVVSPVAVLEVTLVTPRPSPVVPSDPLPSAPQARKVFASSKNIAREKQNVSAFSQSAVDWPASSFTLPQSQPEAPIAQDPTVQATGAVQTPSHFDARYLNNPAPAYPPSSRRAGEQGTVMLRVMVRRDGLPASVEIEKSSGSPSLDVAARDSVRGWRFAPATLGADPIESWVRVPVVFRLN